MKKDAPKKTVKKKATATPKKPITLKVNASFDELMKLAATPTKKR